MHRPSPPLPHSRELQVGSSQMEPAGCSCGCAHCRNHCSTPASALSTWHPSTTSKPFHFFFFQYSRHWFCQPVTISAACGKAEAFDRFQIQRQENTTCEVPAAEPSRADLPSPAARSCVWPSSLLCLLCHPKNITHTHSSCPGSALFLFMAFAALPPVAVSGSWLLVCSLEQELALLSS